MLKLRSFLQKKCRTKTIFFFQRSHVQAQYQTANWRLAVLEKWKPLVDMSAIQGTNQKLALPVSRVRHQQNGALTLIHYATVSTSLVEFYVMFS